MTTILQCIGAITVIVVVAGVIRQRSKCALWRDTYYVDAPPSEHFQRRYVP